MRRAVLMLKPHTSQKIAAALSFSSMLITGFNVTRVCRGVWECELIRISDKTTGCVRGGMRAFSG